MIAVPLFAQVQPAQPPVGVINGNLYPAGYAGWTVPMGNIGPYSWSSNTFCTANAGGTSFPAFTNGTPITILDQQNPSHNEVVTVTSVSFSSQTCSITTSTPIYSHTQFALTTATAGLQEALNANLAITVPTAVVLTADYFLDGGTLTAILSSIKGSTNLNIVDITKTPTGWYQWNGTHYIAVTAGGGGGGGGGVTQINGTPGAFTFGGAGVSCTGTSCTFSGTGGGGGGGPLGTLQSDLLVNNSSNTTGVDANLFVAGSPALSTGLYTPQQASNAANANNGSFIIQPGAARLPFAAAGNNRALDMRADVPATAIGVTEKGAVCDAYTANITLSIGSVNFSISGGTLTSADIGKIVVAVGTVGGTPTAFESAVQSFTSGSTGTLTTAAPFSQLAIASEIGHDDTAAISSAMTAAGAGGTLVFPESAPRYCLTHAQPLRGQSPIGLGRNSQILGFPGEDIFAAPDSAGGAGYTQGIAHIHDLTFWVDARIDATAAWQIIGDTGTVSKPAMYRPIAQNSAVASDPLAPGWFQGSGPNFSGAFNGVGAISSGSPTHMTVASAAYPTNGQTLVFPYLSSVFTTTVASGGGTANIVMSSSYPGATGTQIEFFAGSSPQNLSVAISSGTCPATITLANSINPVAGFESNVAPFGLIQIDSEQFTYFGKSNAGNPSPANTLYGVQCAQNGTTRAAHGSTATVVPLNNFKPTYPWPVTPTINSGDTTPSGNAGFFPGFNVGNAAFAFPTSSGANRSSAQGAWSNNSKIENLTFNSYPGNEVSDPTTQSIRHTAAIYWAQPSYGTTFANLYTLYLFYGIVGGSPSIENGNWLAQQPTADTTHYDGIYTYAAVPYVFPYGNQVTYSNMAAYSEENSSGGTALGADTCYYFTALLNDQTGGLGEANSLDHFKNLYCEPEGGTHALSMPNWEWDTLNSEIEDMHMGGGGEVYISGSNQHWTGGNFNQTATVPAVNFGAQNTADFVSGLGLEPRSNVYGSSALVNFGPGAKFSGLTDGVYGTSTGPYGALQVGNNREPIASQTNETFNTGNTTAPYVSSGGGLITPEEFNSSPAFEANPMSVGWTFDDTSPVTHSYTACNVTNNPGATSCFEYKFHQGMIGVGPGQRIANGKYTLYMSAKDVTAATNTFTFQVGTTCNGIIGTYSIPITNAWPSTAAGVFTKQVDFTGVTAAGCGLELVFQGATTADKVQVGYVDFAPVAEQVYAQTINVTNLNTGGSSTGSTPTGCGQSPVTGISGGYTCPTKGINTYLTANQGSGDATATVTSTSGFSSSGCFFVDTEYECYSSITDGTHFAGLQRGAYTTTAATHNTSAVVVAVSLVLGSVQQTPSTVIAYGTTEPPILGINNPTPYNHGGASVLDINSGTNETWFGINGGINQLSGTTGNTFNSPVSVGTNPFQPAITESGYLLATNGANSAYQPMTLGGGHAGSLNVIATPTITAPTLYNIAGTGSTTYSYVCSGTDFDGNLINGTTASITNGAASWAYPLAIEVTCPYVAGVNTYQIYRTAGGSNQGLLGSGTGPGFSLFDFYGSASGGTPPGSNASSPHISVVGSGNPTITMGTASITFASSAPSGSCVSGSLWTNSGGSPNTLYVCQSSAWVGK